jgi:hypothetical protein
MRKTLSRNWSWLAMPLVGISILLATAAIAACGAPGATAPDTTMPALSPQELELLHHLESGTWHQRKEAENDLINRGAWEVPAVNEMLATTKSPDARARLQALLRRLIHDRALGPSLITMHFKDAAPKAVYGELFRQAWAPLLTSPDNLLDDPSLPKITVDVEHKPFWLVMQQLEHATGFGLTSEADGYRLHRAARIARGPVAISGPFLIVLAGVRPDLTDPQQCWADLTVYAEPKIHLLAIDQNMQITQATDNRGNALQAAPQSTTITPDLEYGPQQISVCLTVPNNHAANLVHLKGSTTASIAVESERVDIADLANAKPRPIESGGAILNFLRCKKSGSIFQVCFACEQDPLDQFQKINVEQPGWQVRVFDATGQLLPRAEAVVTNDGATSQMTLIYGPKLYGKPIPPPQRLVWNVPSEIQVVDLTVDFGDITIPLPGF